MSEGALAGPRPRPMVVGDLRLVPWSVADATDLLAAIDGDAAVATYSISLRTVHDLASARRWLIQRSEPGRVEWSVRAPDGGLVGRIALHDFDDWSASAEVGYSVFPPFRRRGIASRVLEAVTTYGFRELGLNRILLMHETANQASCGVAMRGGYREEGVARDRLVDVAGERCDAHIHARLAADPAGPVEEPDPEGGPRVSLFGDGIRLRPWTFGDEPILLAAIKDPAIQLYTGLGVAASGPAPVTDEASATALIERRRSWAMPAWVIEDADDGTAYGHVAIYHMDLDWQRDGEVGYWLLPEARGKGVATRSVRLVTRYAFDVLGLHRLNLWHAVENPASCRVAEACGFAREGLTRQSWRCGDGVARDEHLHGLLEEDWRAAGA